MAASRQRSALAESQQDWRAGRLEGPDIHHLAKMMSLIRILPVAQLAGPADRQARWSKN